MFEILRAYELAKNEKNKLFRFFYTKYTKYKFKRIFDKMSDIISTESNIELFVNEELINEFIQFVNCTFDDIDLNKSYPYLRYISKYNVILCQYGNIHIGLKIINHELYYTIQMLNVPEDDKRVYESSNGFSNKLLLRSTFTIMYNYCVSYVYGKNSKLYIYSESLNYHLQKLYK